MPQPHAKPQAKGAPGAINVDDLAEKVRANVPKQMLAIFDKAVLSGMRVMFDKSSHQMALAELNEQGPMEVKLSNGIIKLTYLLWTQSNKTLPPQIIVPVVLTLTLKAFQFLQLSQDPQATKEVLGETTALAVQGVMDRFGATQDKLPSLMNSIKKTSNAAPGALMTAPSSDQPAPQAKVAGGMISAKG